jgi:four helix bundle protein
METSYRNKNRGYQQLRVWQDAIDFYVACCRVFKTFSYDLRRVASQGIASADSVHRNIAEGYCRRSIREYLQFLNFALGSLGESVSGLIAYHKAGQLSDSDFASLNALAFKRKEMTGDWIDHLVLKESNVAYETG